MIQLPDSEETHKLEEDPFYKLEHTLTDTQKQQKAAPEIYEIQKYTDKNWKDPYKLSQTMRSKFRLEKGELKKAASDNKSIQDNYSLSIPVLDANDLDSQVAKMIDWGEKVLEKEPSVTDLLAVKPIFKSVLSSSRLSASKVGKTNLASKINPAKEKLLKMAISKRKGDPFGNF